MISQWYLNDISLIFQWYFNDIIPSTPKILSICKFFCYMTGMTTLVRRYWTNSAALRLHRDTSCQADCFQPQQVRRIRFPLPHCFSWLCLMSLKGITDLCHRSSQRCECIIVSHPNFEHRALIFWLPTSINHGTAPLAGFGHLGGSRQRAGWWKWWFEIGGETPSKVNITSSYKFSTFRCFVWTFSLFHILHTWVVSPSDPFWIFLTHWDVERSLNPPILQVEMMGRVQGHGFSRTSTCPALKDPKNHDPAVSMCQYGSKYVHIMFIPLWKEYYLYIYI